MRARLRPGHAWTHRFGAPSAPGDGQYLAHGADRAPSAPSTTSWPRRSPPLIWAQTRKLGFGGSGDQTRRSKIGRRSRRWKNQRDNAEKIDEMGGAVTNAKAEENQRIIELRQGGAGASAAGANTMECTDYFLSPSPVSGARAERAPAARASRATTFTACSRWRCSSRRLPAAFDGTLVDDGGGGGWSGGGGGGRFTRFGGGGRRLASALAPAVARLDGAGPSSLSAAPVIIGEHLCALLLQCSFAFREHLQKLGEADVHRVRRLLLAPTLDGVAAAA